MNLKTKVLLAILGVGLVPLTLIMVLLPRYADKALRENSYNHLISVRDMKSSLLEAHFKAKVRELDLISQLLLDSMKQRGAKRIEAPDHQRLIDLRQYFDQNNLQLFEDDGELSFCAITGGKPPGYNLFASSSRDSQYARAVRRAFDTQQIALGDIDNHPFSEGGESPALFIVKPLSLDSGSKIALAMELKLEGIQQIMGDRAGMGKSGETYLVGPDFRMRSDAFHNPEHNSVAAAFSKLQTGRDSSEPVKQGLLGETGTMEVVNYTGEEVFVAYSPFRFMDLEWAMVASFQKQEALKPLVFLQRLLLKATAIFVLLVVCASALFANRIAVPLHRLVDRLKEIAEGQADLSRVLDESCYGEVGNLARMFNRFVDNLSCIIRNIRGYAHSVSISAAELSSTSSHLAKSSQALLSQFGTVASATEQISTNLNQMSASVQQVSGNATGVAAASEQVSQNMQVISSSVEEISTTIGEISNSTQDSAKAAGQAKQLSECAAKTMQKLGGSARDIGKVTDLIKRIAEQTNLLALNATIEAASAGDAGRGFAVVASEIKELANQSQLAAEDITRSILEVQRRAEEAVRAMDQVGTSIGNVSESIHFVASAVSQQSVAVGEIAKSSVETSMGVHGIATTIAEIAMAAREVARGIGETAGGANQVSVSIHKVHQLIHDDNANIEQIHSASEELGMISIELQTLVDRFKIAQPVKGDLADVAKEPQSHRIKDGP